MLPDYIGMNISEASDLAKEATFNIIVNDSVHIIGKPGGEIRDQNPKPNSKVKENRKVYVTTTKYIADRIKVRGLPSLYGREYERKAKELAFVDINCKIRDYKYDEGEPNHILEVYYKGETIISRSGRKDDVEIEKGSTLEFLVSKPEGGEMAIPDLVCMDFESATFLINGLKLKVGEITSSDKITDRSSAYVVGQSPAYSSESSMEIGDMIQLTLSQEKPANCN